MKVNLWTVGLAAAGVVSLGSIAQGEEAMEAVKTALTSTTLSGYVDASAVWAPGTGNAAVPGYAFNQGKQDGFNLNVAVLTLEKPLDESQWSAGYKVQLAIGPDASTVATGSDNGLDSANIKQAYVALRMPVGNGLDFKLGRWDTIIGYEVFESGNNPNYSRSYGYTMEPYEHTGLLMSYRFSDVISASVGVANTSATGAINSRNGGAESTKTYMGALSVTAPDTMGFLAGSTLYVGAINGLGPNDVGNTPFWLYTGATFATGVEGLRLGVAYDYMGGSEQYWANALAGYISYTFTEKLSAHLRAEYVWMSDFGGTPPVETFSGSTTGDYEQIGVIPPEVFALTATLQYDLWANVVNRLEFRWDYATGGTGYYGGNGTAAKPSDLKNYVTIAWNVIYKF